MTATHSTPRLKPARRVPGSLATGSLYYPCPRASNRTQLCFALCRPVDGMGDCSRAAGHARLGRTQVAILEHARRRALA